MNNKRKVRIPFGIVNIAGLMETKPVKEVDEIVGAEATNPLFCHKSYKIKTTFNKKLNDNKDFGYMHFYESDPDENKFYQKKFRRMVLWDFGDGYSEEGYSVEHTYEKPGRYSITCTLYDINRRAWKNTYSIVVVVKEVIPTQLKFDNDYTKSSISCSKIEQIAKLEATLSLTCKEDLQVHAKRIFSEQEEDSNYEEIGRNYAEIPSEIFKYSRKYWTFLENEQQLLYQSDKVYGDKLTPRDLYTPNYISLYANFYYDDSDKEEPIKILIYQVIPYKTIDDNLKTIRILNPNCKVDDLLSHGGDYQDYVEKFTKVIEIQQVYIQEQLPENAYYVGKRAWVDLFYKNDYLGNKNTFSFYYDIETKNITKELLSSDNYINMMPIGLSIEIKKNDNNLVKVGVSLDGFLRHLDDGNYTIDEYLMQSLVKDTDIDFYFFPYIEYENELVVIDGLELEMNEYTSSDFVSMTKMYYIPKDCEIDDIIITENETDEDNSSWNQYRGIETVEPWLKRTNIYLFDLIDFGINVRIKNGGSVHLDIKKNPLIKPDELSIPTEKMTHENIDTLVDVYMSHPMFDETPTTKDFFTSILKGQNMLNYSLTKSKNFLDDNMNVKTCYLSNLISMLKMMGEDILEYEKGAFEGVNELRDFVRLLSMNHADLVGHVVKKEYDIDVQRDRYGKNVGDQILLTDILRVKKGKLQSLERNGKEYDYTQWDKDGVEIILQDKYTFETKIVNLGLSGGDEVQIQNYLPSWGWNLLLPSKYNDCIYKLQKNQEYYDKNGRNLYGSSEIKRIQQVINQLLDGYYSFYVLNPVVEQKRVGNFLQDDTITERINDPVEWESEWGITHEILMKILRDNGGYKTNEVKVKQRDSETRRVFSKEQIIDEVIDDITFDMCETEDDDYVIGKGSVEAFGYINDEGESTIDLRLVDVYLNDYPVTLVDDMMSITITVKDGYVKPVKYSYSVVSDIYAGQLDVTVCGKIEKTSQGIKGLLWDISMDVYYR